MKNHFIISYFGNKRDEVERIYNNIDLTDVDTIIEPYCGSSALSFYIASLHPKKYKYILNDNDKYLIELYNIMKDEEKLIEFINNINSLVFTSSNHTIFINKERYIEIIKSSTLESWFIARKFYNIRPGIYPNDRKVNAMNDRCPIINFLRTENITLSCDSGLTIIKNNNIKTSLIFLDPPYLSLNNDFYDNSDANIYEWLYLNKHTLINSYICINDVWINRLLFRDCNILEYDKMYQTTKKKNQKHLLIRIN